MNRILQSRFFSFVLFDSFLASALAGGSGSADAFENGGFPALENTSSVSSGIGISETESETETGASESSEEDNPSSLSLQPITEETMDELFGDLPRYLDLGSFVLNRLNHAPVSTITQDGVVLENSSGEQWLIRSSWDTLQRKIEAILESSSGDWSVYLKDLTTGKTMEINEHAMQSASLIKLFIAGTTYEKIENGELEETDTIRDALYNMITVSDNESANVLVRSFCDESGDFQTGLAEVNDFIARYGFSNTQQVNGISDPSLWVSDGRVNETSAADCGRLLELVYNGELVSHYSSLRFEKLLNQQEVNYKIPAALPEGTNISHKTGEDSDTENDVAIIYTPYGDYIFCILSTDASDTGSSVDTIHTVTRLVYDWFTQTPVELNSSAESASDAADAEDNAYSEDY